jgi:hypothetical protein
MPDGRLWPFIENVPVLGCVDVTVSTNGNQRLAFQTSLVLFETAKNPMTEKLN